MTEFESTVLPETQAENFEPAHTIEMPDGGDLEEYKSEVLDRLLASHDIHIAEHACLDCVRTRPGSSA